MSIFLRRQCGFTLLEITIVLVIIGLLTAGSLAMFSAHIGTTQSRDTQNKLAALQKALLAYRRAFNRIPCPADTTADIDATSGNIFGVEAGNPGSCTGGTPAANFSGGSDVAGMVPTKTLSLPDDAAFDGWGRRIEYAVDVNFTATDAFSSIPVTDTTTRMTVKDASGNSRSTIAAYVLVSSGENGHGAYPRTGGVRRINVGSVNADELENCDCDSSATTGTFNGTFVQKPYTSNPTNSNDVFDDVVVYGTRADLRATTE